MINFEFKSVSGKDLDLLCSKRMGEIRLGERITSTLTESTRFAILGIEEDIGPQTNGGNPGSKNAFLPFLQKFLNMQSNSFLNGEEICILGSVKQKCVFENVPNGYSFVNELDDLVTDIIHPLYEKGITPIVIGGGHNNAYPILRAQFLASNQKLDVVNLDPHADCRILEGRHSGNPFSYAAHDGFIANYSVLGLHKAYNNTYILNYLDQKKFFYRFFEEYLDDRSLFYLDIRSIFEKIGVKLGIELDLDSIKNMPSSAYTPSGFSIEEARSYVRQLASSLREISYFHLPEGAPTSSEENLIVGKTIAYLVHDFISCQLNK